MSTSPSFSMSSSEDANSRETDLFIEKDSSYGKLHWRSRRDRVLRLIGYLTATILAIVLALEVGQLLLLSSLKERTDSAKPVHENAKVVAQSGCVSPETRRPWRSLSRAERVEFIDAILCLSTKPSFLIPNTTIYDDFTRIHALNGRICRLHFVVENLANYLQIMMQPVVTHGTDGIYTCFSMP